MDSMLFMLFMCVYGLITPGHFEFRVSRIMSSDSQVTILVLMEQFILYVHKCVFINYSSSA